MAFKDKLWFERQIGQNHRQITSRDIRMDEQRARVERIHLDLSRTNYLKTQDPLKLI